MYFPVLAIVGGGEHARHLRHAADRLGVRVLAQDEADHDQLTERAGLIADLRGDRIQLAPAIDPLATDLSVTDLSATTVQQRTVVLVARSAHGQAATWNPTTVMSHEFPALTVTPAVDERLVDPDLSAELQRIALALIGERGLVGVVAVGFDAQLTPVTVSTRPEESWLWTLDASVTDAYEQHLRALFNLPLGSTQMIAPAIVTMPIVVGEDADMYYPYLHLFARDPGLRIYQRSEPGELGDVVGHVAVCGDDRVDLIDRAEHAALYFAGLVDE